MEERLYNSMSEFIDVYRDRIRPLLIKRNVDGAAIFIQQEMARESSLRPVGSAAEGEVRLALNSGNSEAYARYLICLKMLSGRGSEEKIGEGLRNCDVRKDIINRIDVNVKELCKLLEADKLLI